MKRLRRILAELALDLRWAWSHTADELWEQLDPTLWALTGNPWLVVQSVGDRELEVLSGEGRFRKALKRCRRMQADALAARTWFAGSDAAGRLGPVAFFSMEFGLSEALPIYAGGLGVLGGDYLKAASDLGVPVIGVGLLYTSGYFRQTIDAGGQQHELYPPNVPGQLPIVPARSRDAALVRIGVEFPGRTVFAQTWVARIGRTQLYLLDCNDPANQPADRGITAELYGGNDEQRLQQELVLGIGGWRLLRALNLQPEICHLNEGHAAFAALERTRSLMAETDLSFPEALRATRSGTIFTTHTPVEAAFDRFAAPLAARYLAPHVGPLNVAVDDVLALGRLGHDSTEPLNMAYFAIRCSGSVNGVSRLHGEVSRVLFQPLFPHQPPADVPVGSVTNGVHTPSWDSPEADDLWTSACGGERWRQDLNAVSEDFGRVSDDALWAMRSANRRRLVRQARERLLRRLDATGTTDESRALAAQALDDDVLTIGFARRFTDYKRATLLLRDPDRLARLVTAPLHPIQVVLAGKAHPNDAAGKAMIREWVTFAQRPDVRRRIVFLPDYDLLLAAELVQGCDVWLNTPRRPWEASGTSGMKALVNGGLNLSELDGWWAEAYAPEFGWALGDGREHSGDPNWDAGEADALYRLLEQEIAPRFYARDAAGLPREWIAMMRASMATLTPRFSTNRMLREYLWEYYLPASEAYRRRTAQGGAMARALERAVKALEEGWAQIVFGPVRLEEFDGRTRIAVSVTLGALDPAQVRVELYAETTATQPSEALAMAMTPEPDRPGTYACVAELPFVRPASDYTARVVPNVAELTTPLECSLIAWQR